MQARAVHVKHSNKFGFSGRTGAEAMVLARHRTPALTFDVYGRTHDARLVTIVREVAAATVPTSQRAPRVHARIAGTPLPQQAPEKAISPQRPVMLL